MLTPPSETFGEVMKTRIMSAFARQNPGDLPTSAVKSASSSRPLSTAITSACVDVSGNVTVFIRAVFTSISEQVQIRYSVSPPFQSLTDSVFRKFTVPRLIRTHCMYASARVTSSIGLTWE